MLPGTFFIHRRSGFALTRRTPRRAVAGGRWAAGMRSAAAGGRRAADSRTPADTRPTADTRPAPFACKPVNFHHEAVPADGLMHIVVNSTREGTHGVGRRAGAPLTSPAARAQPSLPTRSASLRESHIRRRDGGMRGRPGRQRPRGTPAPRSARGDSGAPYRAGAAGSARPPPPSRRST